MKRFVNTSTSCAIITPLNSFRKSLPDGVGSTNVATSSLNSLPSYPIRVLLSPTENVPITALNITGAGRLNVIAAVNVQQTTPETIRIKVILDGLTVIDTTSSATNSQNYGLCVVGSTSGGATADTYAGESLYFKYSAKVELTFSLTSTGGAAFYYAYDLLQL